MNEGTGARRAHEIADRVEHFVRSVVMPYGHDPRCGSHGQSEDVVHEPRAKARAVGVLAPHIFPDGSHFTQFEIAMVLKRSGLSPLGTVAVNTAASDGGNMYLLGKIGTKQQREHFLAPLVAGDAFDGPAEVHKWSVAKQIKRYDLDGATK